MSLKRGQPLRNIYKRYSGASKETKYGQVALCPKAPHKYVTMPARTFSPASLPTSLHFTFHRILFKLHNRLSLSLPSLKMLSKTATLLMAVGLTLASPVEVEERQSCPNIHVFGAREMTALACYGTTGVVIDLVLNAHSGATSEAIVYPACGGQSSCGGVSYANSVLQGVPAVASAVNSFNSRCPSTQLVLVGYSQVSNFVPEFHYFREA
jgi:hypothetical protein